MHAIRLRASRWLAEVRVAPPGACARDPPLAGGGVVSGQVVAPVIALFSDGVSETAEDDEEFKKINDWRVSTGSGTYEYRILWNNGEETWEPASNLANAEEALARFQEENGILRSGEAAGEGSWAGTSGGHADFKPRPDDCMRLSVRHIHIGCFGPKTIYLIKISFQKLLSTQNWLQ